MGGFSIIHWLIVLVVVLLIFGPKRLPDLAKALGESVREFKKAIKSEADSTERPKSVDPDKLTSGEQTGGDGSKSENKKGES